MAKGWVKDWGAIIVLASIWGSSFILMKLGMQPGGYALSGEPGGNSTFTWSQVSSIRLASAMLFLLPFAISTIPKVHKEDWKWISIVALCGNGIPAFLFTYAETGISSSLAGILNSLTPIFTLLVAVILFRMQWKAAHAIGILLGMTGAIWMLLGGSGNVVGESKLGYALLVVLATILYALSVNTTRHKLSHMSAIGIASMALLITGIPALILLIFQKPWQVVEMQGWEYSLAASLALGLFGTALAMLIWNGLVQRSGAVFASSVTYLIPPVAMGWGSLSGEEIGIHIVLAMALILAGIAIINFSGPMKSGETPCSVLEKRK
jgi:drug/metabolite transporter (DMT)-like permease